ncbi:MAG: Gfo/Idh/MocA family protein [Fulvivirga sp.]
MSKRREFIKVMAAGAAAIPLSNSTLFAIGNRTIANTINVAVIGVANRGKGLIEGLGSCESVRVSHLCDVDSNVLTDALKFADEKLGYLPDSEGDFRRLLDNKDVDAVVIATPDHWHAPMSIMALQAGKHVYVEKPCSHSMEETQRLQEAQKKYNKLLQMGNQQRSSRTSRLAIKEIKEGMIGTPYLAKAFYYNSRNTIGRGNVIDVPNNLNWDLWQGPAPRESYRDNIHPYHWHWFKTWGTGEIHNNGTHEIDICRWVLGVDYPLSIQSMGGRNHFKEDDWQYPDTQLVNYEYDQGKMITWEGISCNGYTAKKGRGVEVRGTEGTVFISRRNFIQYDREGKEIRREKETDQYAATSTSDTLGFDGMTVSHLRNFVNAIRGDGSLNSPIEEAGITTNLCHLGNIAQELNESLELEPKTGIPINKLAKKKMNRTYEKGWEPNV